MQGPWPVKLLFGWLHHDGRYTSWDLVVGIENERIVISGWASDLPLPGPSS